MSISDSQLIIGEARLLVDHPSPGGWQLGQLMGIDPTYLHALEQRILNLEARVAQLEARSWWDLLKAQLRSWFRRS